MPVTSRTFCTVWFCINSLAYLYQERENSIWNEYFINQRYHNVSCIVDTQCRWYCSGLGQATSQSIWRPGGCVIINLVERGVFPLSFVTLSYSHLAAVSLGVKWIIADYRLFRLEPGLSAMKSQRHKSHMPEFHHGVNILCCHLLLVGPLSSTLLSLDQQGIFARVRPCFDPSSL